MFMNLMCFNSIVLAFLDQFQWTGLSSHGWQIGFLHFPAIVLITLSSVSICHSLSEVDCFGVLWNETLLQSFNIFYASKYCLLFIENEIAHLCASDVTLYFYCWYFIPICCQIRVLHWKCILMPAMVYQLQLVMNIGTLLCFIKYLPYLNMWGPGVA